MKGENRFLCGRCRNRMEVMSIRKYADAGRWPLVILVSGLFCFLFPGGILLGAPLLLAGIYMLTAERTISYCPGCGNHFEVLVKGKGPG